MSISIQINVTIPKALFKDKRWVEEISSVLRNETAPELKRLFRGTTFGWSNHPSFRQHFTRRAYSLSMQVYTEDEIYGLVNAGSKPHRIPRFGNKLMAFRPGYRASTRPGILRSRRAYRSGKTKFVQYITNHPGFAARKFDELVRDEYEPKFRDSIQKAMARAAK